MAKHIYFNNRDEFYRIELSHIVYFEADKNYTYMQLVSGPKVTFTYSLQKMQEHLARSLGDDAKAFARVGKSHIINLHYVYHIDISRKCLRLMTENPGTIYSLKMSIDALKNLRALFVK